MSCTLAVPGCLDSSTKNLPFNQTKFCAAVHDDFGREQREGSTVAVANQTWLGRYLIRSMVFSVGAHDLQRSEQLEVPTGGAKSIVQGALEPVFRQFQTLKGEA